MEKWPAHSLNCLKKMPNGSGERRRKGQDNLKNAVCASPILSPPNFEREFYLDTDASGEGIGGALMQVGEDSKVHAIALVSRRLHDKEKKYSVRELEALAILWSIEQFRDFLIGRKFTT